MKKGKYRYGVLGLSIILWVVTGGATNPPLKLSFAQAWELAQKNNPRIQTARVNLEKAGAQIGEAYAGALPSLTASGYYQRNFIIPEMITELPPEFGGGTAKFQFSQKNMVTGSVELAQPLYAAGRVGLALKIAKLYRQIAETGINVSQSDVKLLVTQLYFGAVLAQRWASVAGETYAQMQGHLEKVEHLQRQGLVSEYDLIRSRVQVSNFFPQVLSSQNAHRVAVEALGMALGLPENSPVELTDNLEAYSISLFPSEDLLARALQQRGELKQVDLQSRILDQLETIEEHGVWWPNLALVGGFSVQAQDPDFKVENYYWSRNLYGGLSLSIPLFDGFRASHRAQQVRVDKKTLSLQRDQLVKGINLEIVQARSKFEEAQKNVQAQEEGVSLARKGFQIAEVQYENGVATQLEVLDAQLALNQAQMNELTARYDLITAQAELNKAIGRE